MKFRLKIQFLLITVLMFCLFGCIQGSRLEERVEKTLPLEKGGDFILSNVNGAIEISSWNQDRVQILALKKVKAGSRQEAERFMERLQINIDAESDRIEIESYRQY